MSDRRRFIRLAGLGASVGLFGLFAPSQVRSAAAVEALLLSCMDYRLMDDIVVYMNSRGLKNDYDHLILAGASLGVLTDQQPAWGQIFWEHVEIAVALHSVRRLMVLDHRDCGAYKAFLGEAHLASAASEREAHAENLHALRDQLAIRFPALQSELLLMSLDGSVETIS